MSCFAFRTLILLVTLLVSWGSASDAQRLFVGLEVSGPPPTRSTDLTGFPDVTWEDHFSFDVSGAAATPEGQLYLCHGAYTTELYRSTLEGPPEHLTTISEDMSALAFGRGTLWGYSNYAEPKGIYAIDPVTGGVELVLDVYTGPHYRFFALDYNPVDDKLYGYTEYGTTGLYRIDIDSGEMTFIVGRIPASNGQGRGLAVGRNTVYLTATRGDDDIPHFAYDLEQGIGGEWAAFTNAYPTEHATGGAAWIPDPTAGIGDARHRPQLRLAPVGPNPGRGAATITFDLRAATRAELDILDLTGRHIVRLAAGELPAGPHAVVWQGRDQGGAPVGAGTYFVRLRAGGMVATRSLSLIW